TMYAMVDRDDDLRVGIKSTAILFGRFDRLVIGLLQLLMLGLLWTAGQWANLGWIYLSSLAVAAGLFAYQQFLIRERDRNACFRAFLNNHYLGMTVFVGVMLDFLAGSA
ncbi:MAG: UbiA family prenyltransferase, partial [Gammaproteobacteria bacterium]|nr:UbiA family prenyltransferase [Gammaproteobacteria bacterium]